MDKLYSYQQEFKANFQQQYDNLYPIEDRSMAYFDINIDEEYVGRVIFELFDEIVPKTVDNFLFLCKNRDKFRTYRKVPFHKIIKDVGVYGGDITMGNGRGGWSVYGETFPCENFIAKHKIEGLLSMLPKYPGTNGSQFMITTFPLPWLDGKHVVFGRVIKGYEIVKQMEQCGDSLGKPIKRVEIYDCGIYGGRYNIRLNS